MFRLCWKCGDMKLWLRCCDYYVHGWGEVRLCKACAQLVDAAIKKFVGEKAA